MSRRMCHPVAVNRHPELDSGSRKAGKAQNAFEMLKEVQHDVKPEAESSFN